MTNRFSVWLLAFAQVVFALLLITHHISERRWVSATVPHTAATNSTIPINATSEPASYVETLFNKLGEPLLWVTVALAVLAFWQIKVYEQIRDHAATIERAYINVTDIAYFEGYVPGNEPEIVFNVENTGHTPGWLLDAAAALIPVADVSKHLPRPMPIEQMGMRRHRQVIFAGQKTQWGHKMHPIDPSEFKLVKAGQWKLVAFGRIRYRDTFNAVHFTDFSFVWDQFREGRSTTGHFKIHPDGYTDAD